MDKVSYSGLIRALFVDSDSPTQALHILLWWNFTSLLYQRAVLMYRGSEHTVPTSNCQLNVEQSSIPTHYLTMI
jgi:hypothetical protein